MKRVETTVDVTPSYIPYRSVNITRKARKRTQGCKARPKNNKNKSIKLAFMYVQKCNDIVTRECTGKMFKERKLDLLPSSS